MQHLSTPKSATHWNAIYFNTSTSLVICFNTYYGVTLSCYHNQPFISKYVICHYFWLVTISYFNRGLQIDE